MAVTALPALPWLLRRDSPRPALSGDLNLPSGSRRVCSPGSTRPQAIRPDSQQVKGLRGWGLSPRPAPAASRSRPRASPPPLTVLPDQSEAQLVLVPGLLLLLAEALEKVRRHALDRRVRVDRGQHPVVVTQQPVQHEQGQGGRGGVGVDHDVLQGPIVLVTTERGIPEAACADAESGARLRPKQASGLRPLRSSHPQQGTDGSHQGLSAQEEAELRGQLTPTLHPCTAAPRNKR